MNLVNNFLYSILNDYVDLDSIINTSISNKTLKITDDKLKCKYVFMENLVDLELNLKQNEIEGYIKTNEVIERFNSKFIDNKYISSYRKSTRNLDDTKIKKVFKTTSYDNNKKLIKREENIENEAYLRNGRILKPIENLCNIENTKIYLINDILIQKQIIKYPYNVKRNKTIYSYSNDYKKGFFGSEVTIPQEYYAGFKQLSKKKSKKY